MGHFWHTMLCSHTMLGTNIDSEHVLPWCCPTCDPVLSCVGCILLTIRNTSALSLHVWMLCVPWLKIGLKAGERSFGKGLVEHRWFQNGFIFRVYAHPIHRCCFSSSPERFTSVLIKKLLFSSRLSFFLCNCPWHFLWEYLYSPGQLPPRSSFSLPTSPAAFPICKH